MKFGRNQPRSQPIVRVARLAGPELVALLSRSTTSSLLTRPTTKLESQSRCSAVACTSSSSHEIISMCHFSGRVVRPVPPAAAQRLKQCGGVGVAGGLRLNESNQSRLVGVLGGEQPEIGNGTELQLATHDFEALEGCALRRIRGLQRLGVGL